MSDKYRAEPCTTIKPPQHTLLPAMPRLSASQLRGPHTTSPRAPLFFKKKQTKKNPNAKPTPPLHDYQPHNSGPRLFLKGSLPPYCFFYLQG